MGYQYNDPEVINALPGCIYRLSQWTRLPRRDRRDPLMKLTKECGAREGRPPCEQDPHELGEGRCPYYPA